MDALAPLVARRVQEGWTVQIADVQDIYDEQGFGDKSPAAIRRFIQRARASWRVPPRFVLFVGDATFDPRNFTGLGDFDFVPTRLIDTAALETASDDWFVDDDLDGVPEIAIGRLPVRTGAQASTIVGKLLGYAGKANLPRGGLFVTDTDEVDLDFSGASTAGEAKVSDIMPVDRFQRGTSGTADALLAKLNAGPFLVNYLGHGSVEVWDNLLTTAQAAALTNDHVSIYVVMNCLNGFFHDFNTTSIAESLITAPQGGAVAVWASSSLAEFAPQPAFNQEFLMRLSRTSLGEAATAAKSRITDLETRRTWLLFGNPTLFGVPTAVTPPPMDGGTDGDAMEAGTTEAGMEAGTDMGAEMDGGAPDVGMTPDGGADATERPDTSATPDGGTDAGRADTGADGGGTLPPRDGCACSAGGGSSFGGGAIGLSLFGLVLGARRRRRSRPRGRAVGLATVALLVLAWAARAEAAYTYRMAITIDRTRIGTSTGATTLSNYPLLLDITSANLKSSGGGAHVTSSNGYDISFQGADTTTCGGPSTCIFNYEIESYTSTGSSGHVIAWVNIPVLKTAANTADTVIYVKYGDATVTTPTQNQNGTWNSNFKGVWHLNQAATPQTDSTSTPSNASHNGAPAPATATGLISSGVSMSSTTGTAYLDYRSTKFNWTSSDTFTYQGWFKTTDGNGPLFSQRDNVTGNADIDIHVGYNGATTNTNKMSVLVRDDTGRQLRRGQRLDGRQRQRLAPFRGHAFRRHDRGLRRRRVRLAPVRARAPRQHHHGEHGLPEHRTRRDLGADRPTASTGRSIPGGDVRRVPHLEHRPRRRVDQDRLQHAGDAGLDLRAGHGAERHLRQRHESRRRSVRRRQHRQRRRLQQLVHARVGLHLQHGDAERLLDDVRRRHRRGLRGLRRRRHHQRQRLQRDLHGRDHVPLQRLTQHVHRRTVRLLQDDHDRSNEGRNALSSTPTTLSNYPVLISVTDPALARTTSGGHVRNVNGYDIIFRGLDTVTCGGPSACTFPHQIEKYVTTTGELVAWVNVPALNSRTNTANTQFRIMYGNQAISTSTERVTSTWNSGFTGVWHLNQTPGGAGTHDRRDIEHQRHAHQRQRARGGQDGRRRDPERHRELHRDGLRGVAERREAGATSRIPCGSTRRTRSAGSSRSARARTTNPVIDVMVGMDGANTAPGQLMVFGRDDSGGGLGDVVRAVGVQHRGRGTS